MAVTKTELHKVITKLDDVKIELLRLRADLLPEERPTASEKREIDQGRREIGGPSHFLSVVTRGGRVGALEQMQRAFKVLKPSSWHGF